jgi:uncharacterized OB-fold protein
MSAAILPEVLLEKLDDSPGEGVVYSETIVWSAREQFVQDVPYQLVIVTLDKGGRLTGRITGEMVRIDDPVEFAEYRGGIPYFRKVI